MKVIRQTVSREQCRVLVEPDGTAVLIARGKGQTLWKARDDTRMGWNALYAGEEKVLSDGDLISINWNDPEAAVFRIRAGQPEGGYYAGQHHGGAVSGAQRAEAQRDFGPRQDQLQDPTILTRSYPLQPGYVQDGYYDLTLRGLSLTQP